MTSDSHGEKPFLTSGRITTFIVLFVVLGVSAPFLARLPWSKGIGPALSAGLAELSGDTAKVTRRVPAMPVALGKEGAAMKTKIRMRSVVAELKNTARREGSEPKASLASLVGNDAMVGWGRRMEYVPPGSNDGWLRSFGKDGRPGKDDIVVPIPAGSLR